MTPFLSLHTRTMSIRITHESPVQIMTHYRWPHTHGDSCYLPPYGWHVLNLEGRLSTSASPSTDRCVSAVTESQVFVASVKGPTAADEAKRAGRWPLFGVGFRICARLRWPIWQKRTKWSKWKNRTPRKRASVARRWWYSNTTAFGGLKDRWRWTEMTSEIMFIAKKLLFFTWSDFYFHTL